MRPFVNNIRGVELLLLLLVLLVLVLVLVLLLLLVLLVLLALLGLVVSGGAGGGRPSGRRVAGRGLRTPGRLAEASGPVRNPGGSAQCYRKRLLHPGRAQCVAHWGGQQPSVRL